MSAQHVFSTQPDRQRMLNFHPLWSQAKQDATALTAQHDADRSGNMRACGTTVACSAQLLAHVLHLQRVRLGHVAAVEVDRRLRQQRGVILPPMVCLPRCHLKRPQRCLSVVLQVTGVHPA
jgi:hypothetical protein